MNRYGQTITWSTVSAPHPFTGMLSSFSARDVAQDKLIEDDSGDNLALILDGQKIEYSLDARVTDGTTDFLDLSAGAKIAVSGITGGTLLCSRAVESWALGREKTCSLSFTKYAFTGGSGASAGTDLDAVTPSQAGLTIVTPGGKIVYGTYGLTHAAGVVHALTIEQMLTITDDDLAPDGTIPGATSHAYKRMIRLSLLSTSTKPAVNSTLAITGAPDHAADYKIISSEERYAEKRGKMYEISAVWIPPFTA